MIEVCIPIDQIIWCNTAKISFPRATYGLHGMRIRMQGFYKPVSVVRLPVGHCIMDIANRLTVSGVAQLSAHHTGIHNSPGIITHSAPALVHANLHTTLLFHGTALQPDVAIIAYTWGMLESFSRLVPHYTFSSINKLVFLYQLHDRIQLYPSSVAQLLTHLLPSHPLTHNHLLTHLNALVPSLTHKLCIHAPPVPHLQHPLSTLSHVRYYH